MRSSRSGAAIASAAVLVLALAATQPAANAHRAAIPSAEQVFGWLNQQRVTNGLPALSLDASMSAGCAAHNSYMALNHSYDHIEDPSKPGYSSAGALAGRSAALDDAYWLAPSRGSSSFGDPFENAPFHLKSLLSPWLGSVGIDQHAGFLCIANAGMGTAPAGVLYVYPGNGSNGWAPRETSNEWPTTPEKALGLNINVGKHLYLWYIGPLAAQRLTLVVQSASLSDGSGNTVPLRWCDSSCAVSPSWLIGLATAILIPTEPLKAKTTYHASVSASTPFGVLSRNWSFTTGGGTSSGSDSGWDTGTSTSTNPTPPAPTGPGCDAPNGSLNVGIGVTGWASITLQCHPANLHLRLTVSRLDTNGQIVHRYPAVSAQSSEGVLNVRYRRLFAGRPRVGRYQLLLQPADGRAQASRFSVNR